MKSVISVLLLGVLCAGVLSEDPEKMVKVDPEFEFDLYGSSPAPGFNVSSEDQKKLDALFVSMNLFSAPDNMHPFYTNQPKCSCADSQNMILKVAGLLQSLSNLLTLCGSPEFCHVDFPLPLDLPHTTPSPNPEDPDFGKAESHDFDQAIDDMVSVLLEQIKEEIGEDTVDAATDEAVDEIKEEIKKEEEKEEEKEKVAKSEGKDEVSGQKKYQKKGPKKELDEKEKEKEKDESYGTVSLMDVLNMSR